MQIIRPKKRSDTMESLEWSYEISDTTQYTQYIPGELDT